MTYGNAPHPVAGTLSLLKCTSADRCVQGLSTGVDQWSSGGPLTISIATPCPGPTEADMLDCGISIQPTPQVILLQVQV